MTGTIRRKVTLAEARPGDRVTVTGTIQPPLSSQGFTIHGAATMLGMTLRHDNAMLIVDDVPGVDITIEREVQTTDQEPTGLGAVVRTDTGRTFVRLAMDRRWRWGDVGGGTPVSWAEVLNLADVGAVEVLAEGWVEP